MKISKISHLYIHYPFCFSKCFYCDFYSVIYNKNLFNKYLNILEKEIAEYKNIYNINKLKTIYIGGGNPSLNLDDLKKIIELINKFIDLDNIIEFSIEVNPVNISFNFVDFIKNIKNIRISTGIQSFNEKVLNYCNRKNQNKKIIYDCFDLLAKYNINCSIDLINGLPFTDIEIELLNLNKILNNYKNINHISFYDLTIEKNSKFYLNNENNLLSDKERNIYEKEFIRLIKSYNFKQYEISNFCKKGFASKHNLGYWKYKNYLGLGPSAHSKIENLKIENLPDIEYYINDNYKNRFFLTKKEQIEEFLLMGFRLTNGILKKDFKKLSGFDIEILINNNIKKYIIDSKNRVKIKKRYLNILNKILILFYFEIEKFLK